VKRNKQKQKSFSFGLIDQRCRQGPMVVSQEVAEVGPDGGADTETITVITGQGQDCE